MRPLLQILALLALGSVAIGACACGSDRDERCTTDDDCKAGSRCAPRPMSKGVDDKRCVVGALCVSDTECGAEDPRKRCTIDEATYQCVLRDGFADECDAARPCAFGQFCSRLLGRCLEASSARDCARRSQCPSGQLCDRAAAKCVADPGCFGAAFCEANEVCDLVSHDCRPVDVVCESCLLGPCSGERACSDTKECLASGAIPECRTGERCDPLGRCIQCASTNDCGPGLFCNVALGRCESTTQCATDPSECPDAREVECITCSSPEVCNLRTRKCEAPPTNCQNDVDCPGDRFCDTSKDPPICVPRAPDCLDDLLEEPTRNDRFETAHTLDPNLGPTYPELKLCAGDEDWYRVEVDAGTYLTIDARFRQEDGDLDLQLFLPDGRTPIIESRSANSNERVALEVGTNQVLLLRVFFATPSINAVPYRLVISRDTGSICADDAHEPDDRPAEAKRLLSDAPYEGRVCAADPDWYVLENVSVGTRITLSLELTDNLGDLDLELYRAQHASPLSTSRSFKDSEIIVHDASATGDYFVRVVGKGADSNVYTLRANLRESPAPVCTDDRFEPNDLPSTRTGTSAVVGARLDDLTICDGDADWFGVTLAQGEALWAAIGFARPADLDLGLYVDSPNLDRRSTPLRASTGTGPREYVSLRSTEGGRFLVRVHAHEPDQSSAYALELGRAPARGTCMPDVADDSGMGNTRLEALPLGPAPARVSERSLCAGDTDWYRLSPSESDLLIRLESISDDGSVDFALHDNLGAQLIDTRGGASSDLKALIVPARLGAVYVRVFTEETGPALAIERYALTVDALSGFVCLPDAAEPNDGVEEASPVVSSTTASMEVRDLTLCTRISFTGFGDEDWFILRPPRVGARIFAEIAHESGDLFLELIGPSGGNRACRNEGMDRCYSDTYDLHESVTFTSTVTGPYFLRVGSIYSNPTVPTPPPDADTRYVLRVRYTEP